ncbi:hypothetical protein [Janthinobacterium sp. HLX7-2]|uniref:hypothetical protein n=1 Tax=Janthinobacterium sp. HLX7-2 TaxID=1259331 RepID=UPI003F276B40
MNTHDKEDHEANDGQLNALLASLPQPAPSSALDAAILADAEKALHKPVASNDSADGVRRTLPVKKAPDYMQRWRIPLGLAAAVLLTVNMIGVDWFGSKPAQLPVIGEPVTRDVMPAPAAAPVDAEALARSSAPVTQPPAMSKAAPKPPAQAAPAPLPPPPVMEIRQAMDQQAESALQRQAPVQRALAMPVPVVSRAAPMPPPAKLDASVWLVKIDALLKAGEAALAQEEWAAFRQAYPDYPVAGELQRRLEKPRQ